MHAAVAAGLIALPVGCDSPKPLFEPVPTSEAPQPSQDQPEKRPAVPVAPSPREDAVPGAVVVRDRSSTQQPVSVRCAKTERLIGGGCDGMYAPRGWPIRYTKSDTMGAGWTCALDENFISAGPVHAYALCQVPYPTPGDPPKAGAPAAPK